MKTLLFVSLALCLLVSCASPDASPDGDGERPLVVTSFYAMYDFTSALAGDRAHVRVLVPPGSEPHSWEPSAGDMAALSDARLFVYNGLGMEPFAPGLIDAAANPELVCVEAAADIEPLPGDPHVWLDPRNAAVQYEAICAGLCEMDPDGADYYRERLAGISSALEKLDGDYREAAASFKTKDLVVAHAAFGYLCGAYGLRQIAVTGLSAEGEPSASEMADILAFIEESGTRAVFTEELLSKKVAQAIARDTGAEIYELTPFESGDTDYLTAMRENLETLKTALG